MVEALCLIAQGYLYEDVAEKLGLALITIKQYPRNIKKILKNN